MTRGGLSGSVLAVLVLAGTAAAALGQTASFHVLQSVSQFSQGTYGSANGGAVLLEGFAQPGDGGGGLFTSPPTGTGQGACMTTKGIIGGSPSGSQITAVSPFPLGLVIGMQVSGQGITQTTTVTGFSVVNQTITISPAASAETQAYPYNFTLPTMVRLFDGWSFLDGGGYCFTRASSTFSQKEWGAVSDGSTDDTPSLQNWLYANEPHMAVAGNSVIKSPLYCGVYPYDETTQTYPTATDGGVIQGPPASAIGGSNQKPAFVISANDINNTRQQGLNSNFTAAGAMLILGQSQCGLSAAGVAGNSTLQTSGANYNLVDATIAHDSVLNNSQLYGGWDGVDCFHLTGTNSKYADFTVEDSSIVLAADDGIAGHCPNLKIEGNIISGTGVAGVNYPATQGLVEDNLFEKNYGNGLNCSGEQLALDGNYFDDNGLGTSGTYNLLFGGCDAASVVGNIFFRGGGATEGTDQTASQMFFQGQNDSIALAGNTDFVGNDVDAPGMRPDYDIELKNTSGAQVTDFSYADAATPQNAVGASQSGIFGPNAAALIGPIFQPVQRNYLTGLATQAVTGSPKQLSIQPGAAADALNVQLITLPSACAVLLTKNGVGGLDSGGAVAANTQYNFFVFAQGGYASAPNCIATLASNPSPDFAATFNDGANAAPYATLSGFVSNSTYVVNVTQTPCAVSQNVWTCPNQNPFGGLAVGDAVTDAKNYIPAGTTIAALSSTSNVLSGVMVAPSSPPQYVAVSAAQAQNLYVGEMMGNGSPSQGATFNSWVPGNTYITAIYAAGSCSISPGPCVALNNELSCPSGNSCQANLVASGAFTITLSQAASCNPCQTPDTLYVFNDRYRLVASLYTDSNKDIVGFTQNGDTFLFDSPSPDISTTSLVPLTPTEFVLGSVPAGQPVEAFGRCVANAMVHIFSPGATPGEPVPFSSGPPGYDTQALNVAQTLPDTSFPFRVWTDAASDVYAESGLNATNHTTLYCMTDGYVLPVGQEKAVYPPSAPKTARKARVAGP